jgi:hypothetical protein
VQDDPVCNHACAIVGNHENVMSIKCWRRKQLALFFFLKKRHARLAQPELNVDHYTNCEIGNRQQIRQRHTIGLGVHTPYANNVYHNNHTTPPHHNHTPTPHPLHTPPPHHTTTPPKRKSSASAIRLQSCNH